MKKLLLGAAAAAAFTATPANAAAIVQLEQVGNSMVISLSGSLNIDGMTRLSPALYGRSQNSLLQANGTQIAFGPSGTNNMNAYAGMTGPTPKFSFTGAFNAVSYTGPTTSIFFDLGRLLLPAGYVSGQALANTSIFNNVSYASLNVTEGSSFVYQLPNDTLTVRIGVLAGGVPEPSTWALLILGFGAVGGAMRRKATVRVAYA